MIKYKLMSILLNNKFNNIDISLISTNLIQQYDNFNLKYIEIKLKI